MTSTSLLQPPCVTASRRIYEHSAFVISATMRSTLYRDTYHRIDENPEVIVVTADTHENYTLPPDYVQSLLAKMSPEMADQLIGGKLINVSSRFVLLMESPGAVVGIHRPGWQHEEALIISCRKPEASRYWGA